MEALPHIYEGKDILSSLDASLLQDNVLSPILNIQNPRTDPRIGFVGGIKPNSYLTDLVDSGKFKLCFIMYPVTINQIFEIADASCTMPPKSTWFEPKLKSGLFIHEF